MPSSSVGSSRRARFEQKSLVRQTVIFLGSAIILLVLFLFVILPALVRLIAGNGKLTANSTDDSLTIQPPTLSAPVSATSSGKIAITGYSQKENQVVILDNQQEVQRITPKDDGSFRIDVPLSPGPNKISAYNVTADNKQSPQTSDFTVLYENQPPKLDISEPTDGQNIQGKKNQNLSIKGTTQKSARITVNDRLVFVKDDGSFTTLYFLGDGSTTLDIKATDEAGNVTEKKINVTFTE